MIGEIGVQIEITSTVAILRSESLYGGSFVLFVDLSVTYSMQFTFFMINNVSVNVRDVPDKRDRLCTTEITGS
jgi:hypothetical protein